MIAFCVIEWMIVPIQISSWRNYELATTPIYVCSRCDIDPCEDLIYDFIADYVMMLTGISVKCYNSVMAQFTLPDKITTPRSINISKW